MQEEGQSCVTEKGKCLSAGPASLPPSPLGSPSLRQQQLKCRLCSSSSALLSLPLLAICFFLTTGGNHTLLLFLARSLPFLTSSSFSFFLSVPRSLDQSEYLSSVFFSVKTSLLSVSLETDERGNVAVSCPLLF